LQLLADVEAGYKPVPYHNSVHGADVTHAMHCLLSTPALSPLVKDEPLLMFTALIAAIVHDLGHDGYNNAFHINSSSELAISALYSAPLERHHAASAFALLARPKSVLARLSLHERKSVHNTMRELILATDFGVHMDVLNDFRACMQIRGSTRPDVTTLEGDEKVLALKMAIKTADLGYLTKGKKNVLTWTDRVLEEFFTQGDTERRLGLPVSFGCDRESVDLAESQVGFYSFMVKPLYEAMDLLVPMERQLLNLEDMRSYWQTKKDEKAAKAAVSS